MNVDTTHICAVDGRIGSSGAQEKKMVKRVQGRVLCGTGNKIRSKKEQYVVLYVPT